MIVDDVKIITLAGLVPAIHAAGLNRFFQCDAVAWSELPCTKTDLAIALNGVGGRVKPGHDGK